MAWHARQRGLDVLVLDAAFAGAATPASAGVLWPLEALQPDSPYWPWLEEALPLWADWPQRVGLASEAVGFTHPGLLRLDARPGELRRGERWREARESCPEGAWVEQARRISPADWQQA
ncbi:MAG: FAD-dependent oxidoreductase, partial [Oceanococcaceae bacterium]